MAGIGFKKMWVISLEPSIVPLFEYYLLTSEKLMRITSHLIFDFVKDCFVVCSSFRQVS